MNPNTNCLEGMRCPSCGSYGPFRIDAVVTVLVHDNGTEDMNGEYEWQDNNRCACNACAHLATIINFVEKEAAA